MRVIPIIVSFMLGLLCSLSVKQKETIVEEKIVKVPLEVLTPGQNIIEYIGIDLEEESKPVSILSKLIDPNSVPVTKNWYIHNWESTIDHLWSHHQVRPEQVQGWTEDQMAKLHSYLHNGGERFWEK